MEEKLKKIIPKIKLPKTKKARAAVSLRTTKDELNYEKAKKKGKSTPLIDEPRIREWQHWALINNSYPYTFAYKIHHLLIPKREVPETELNDEEHQELLLIYQELGREKIYDCRLVNFTKKQSIPHHYHIHLMAYKDRRKDMKL